MLKWEVIKELWEKNGYPSSYDLQKILARKKIIIDDGNIRKYIRKWHQDIQIQKKEFNWNKRGRKLWSRLEMESKEFIEYHQLEPYKLFIAPDDKKPIGISFISDQHFGGEGVDYKRARLDAILVGKTDGLYAIDGGDSADNFINTKIMPAIINSKTAPVDQISLLKVYYEWFNGKLIAKLSGNHEFWTKKYAGVDFYDILKPDTIIPDIYSRHQAKVTVFAGDIEYRIMIRHLYRYNSSFNMTHTVKRMWEQADWDFDIGVVCHHHIPTIEPFTRHGQEKWAVRPGSYKIVDSYNDEKGFYGAKVACPTAILYPDRKEMQMFKDIRPAVRFLKMERKKYGEGQ